MRFLVIIIWIFFTTFTYAKSVYFDGEDRSIDAFLATDNTNMQNVYDSEKYSRVASMARGVYDIGLDARAWNNREDKFISWDMRISGNYTLYISINTTKGQRWIFFNDLNVNVGFHGAGVLKGIGMDTNNNSWQRVIIDIDRALKDTEPDNEIISVDGMRFRLIENAGSIDNIVLFTPKRRVYEDAEHGIEQWQVTDNTPDGASISVIHDDEVITLNQRRNDPPIEFAYADNVIQLSGDGRNNAFTIGAVEGERAWNNRDYKTLTWKMRTAERFSVTVHILTTNGIRDMIYTDIRADNGLSDNGLSIHHGLGRSRNGDGVAYGRGTDDRWQTFVVDLVDDLRDYEPQNRVIAVNGITIRGDTLVDDIELLGDISTTSAQIYEDAEDGTLDGWRATTGSINDIHNTQDNNNRVIEFRGGATGVYILGDINSANGWNDTTHTHISWRVRSTNPASIYVAVQTTFGLRYLFYTDSPNRGLRHGFEGGIHHGLGGSIINGQWKTITRDLQRDLKDAEPTNELLAINGFIYNGGDGSMIDDLVLFTPEENLYEDAQSGSDRWIVSDNTPAGATITNPIDHDLQNRGLQGRVIGLEGAGFDNAYSFTVGEEDNRILQWRFRDFGTAPEVIDPRGIIRDPNAFEFRVTVQTTSGARDLVYTLGAEDLGLIEGDSAIHHALGDDRIRGSVWVGDDPQNELGLWQGITRDLENDIQDFEPNNQLISIDSFQVRGSGLIDSIKTLSRANISRENSQDGGNDSLPSVTYEDAEDGNTNGWSLYDNVSGTATINNIVDETRGSRVIELSGSATDGYRLGDESGNDIWDRDHNIFRWSINSSSYFTIYIMIETSDGLRYMVYNPRDDSRGVRGQYIRIGLGADASDGTWHTFTRDLEADLQEYEPDNALVAIRAFLIRGVARLDDIVAVGDDDTPPTNEVAIVYEDAQDGDTEGWSVYDNASGTATMSNIVDETKNSRVIELTGGIADGYRLNREDGSNISDTENSILRWSINTSDYFTLYVMVETDNGIRYLVYNPRDDSRGVRGQYIRIGIGSDARDGTWQTFTRDLEADLQEYEVGNHITSIRTLFIRGVLRIDDIEALSEIGENPTPDNTIYEDAEDGNTDSWSIYDNASGNALVSNIIDETKNSRVIELTGATADGYRLNNIDDTEHKTVKWNINSSNYFTIYVMVETDNGIRYLVYNPRDDSRGLRGQYVRIGIGADASNGTWQTFTRDLEADLQEYEADNHISSIRTILIRGVLRIDDIEGL